MFIHLVLLLILGSFLLVRWLIIAAVWAAVVVLFLPLILGFVMIGIIEVLLDSLIRRFETDDSQRSGPRYTKSLPGDLLLGQSLSGLLFGLLSFASLGWALALADYFF